MARYAMGTDRMVDTDIAQQSWPDATKWDGKQHVGKSTGDPWIREQLYLSAQGNYYIVTTNSRAPEEASARWCEPTQAVLWLHMMGHELPEELKGIAAQVVE